METLQSAAGIAALLGLAWLISENRRAVEWKCVGIGLGGSFLIAAFLLKVPQAQTVFALVNDGVDAIADATRAGSEFVLAFQALPVVLVMSVLTTLLFYWRILPPIVRGFALALEKTLGIGGAVGLSTAANIFLGMVEAPLFIRPYLAKLSRGELFIVMVGGMAGIAGTVFVIYATLLRPVIPEAAGHLLIASVLGAPVAVLIGRASCRERV